jgi:hypothetical protein
MKPKEIERWRKVRGKGLPHFIVRTGMLAYGLPMFFVVNFVDPPKMPLNVTDLVVMLLICAVAGGSAFAYAVWLVQEKRLQKALGKTGA